MENNVETSKVREVSCDGEKESPHPLVYLYIKNNNITCPYCSKIFTLSEV